MSFQRFTDTLVSYIIGTTSIVSYNNCLYLYKPFNALPPASPSFNLTIQLKFNP